MAFLPQEIIRSKRDGRRLSDDEIGQFVTGLVAGAVTDGQAGAFAMAVFFRGLDAGERVALTRAMATSGTTMSWDLPGPVIDKHSTGGVGDTVSLMLAPMVAACGIFVPMISGRGLGHTGGTMDKMMSIPGYDTKPTSQRFHEVVADIGCAIIGQTADLAPADGRLYGIRDVTATVESIGLITASILSKKLAAGLDGLAMDVKVGNGAFCPTHDEARALADSLIEVATGAGLPTTALLTDMDRPLADAAGNALEVASAVDYLTGARREERMHEVVVALGVEMLLLGRVATDPAAARAALQHALDSGEAAERFDRMVAALGGPTGFVADPWSHMETAPVRFEVHPDEAGTVRRIDTRDVGVAVVVLGGGRRRPEDPVDHAVGLSGLATVGDEVGPGRPLGVVHARNDDEAAQAALMIRNAFHVDGPAVEPYPAVIERVVLD